MQKTYRQYMDALNDKNQTWRPEMLWLGKQLRFDPEKHKDADGWLDEVLDPRDLRTWVIERLEIMHSRKMSKGILGDRAVSSSFSVFVFERP